MSNEPVETKVTAATIGAGTGTVISTFLVWGLDEWVWKSSDVPDPVVGMVYLIVASSLAFWAGYRAKHSPR